MKYLYRTRFSAHAVLVWLASALAFAVQFWLVSEVWRNLALSDSLAARGAAAGALILFWLCLGIGLMLLRNFPVIKAGAWGVSFNSLLGKRQVAWADITRFEQGAVRTLALLPLQAFPDRATVLYLKNGHEVVIWERHYRNLHHLLQLLHHQLRQPGAFPEKLPLQPRLRPGPGRLYTYNVQKFSGRQWVAAGWLVLPALLGFLLALGRSAGDPGMALPVLLLLLAVFWLIFASQMYHFLVADGELLVRSRYLPGFSRSYHLADIRSAKVVHIPKRGEALHLVFRDFSAKIFVSLPLGEAGLQKLVKYLNRGLVNSEQPARKVEG